jgi:hypothetical protein
MKAISLALLLLAVTQLASPGFDIDLWPGEGIPVFGASSTSVTLREFPSASAPITKVATVSRDQRLTFDDTRYRTVEPGRIRVLAAARVSGRMIGNVTRLTRQDYYSGKYPPAAIDVVPGMTFDYLQYRAEGTCFVRMNGQVIDADPCPDNPPLFIVETQPKTEWWIRTAIDTAVGWALVTDSNIKVLTREF